MHITAILYFVTVLLCVVTVNEACECAEVHPQTKFCYVDFGKNSVVCVFIWASFHSR